MTDNEENTPEDTDTEVASEMTETREGPDELAGGPNGAPEPIDDEPEAFPRAYVERLRSENAKYRQRAQDADTYAQRLHTELVRATGKLLDPTDMPFDPEHLADRDKLSLAIEQLIEQKPHLAARKPVGNIGQGPSVSPATVDLAAILRGKAG